MKPTRIYIEFESEELSPMEILEPILDKLDDRVKTPAYRALDYAGCKHPQKIILVGMEKVVKK